jgi:hypothetical protein
MVHIVGWGESEEKPKNIHTIDKSGNAWYAGDVKADNISLVAVSGVANAAKTKIDSLYDKSLNSVKLENALISGAHSAAFGESTNTGNYAFSEGYKTTNIGGHAHIEGSSNNTAISSLTKYNDSNGTSLTLADINVQNIDAIWGKGNFALSAGKGTHVEGHNNVAIGESAHAEGYCTKALANYAHAGGNGTKATVESQTAIGRFNAVDADALFIVGNGTGLESNKRQNAFVVKKDGTGYLGDKKIATSDDIGDINSTLDAIIAIQESLIGGNV